MSCVNPPHFCFLSCRVSVVYGWLLLSVKLLTCAGIVHKRDPFDRLVEVPSRRPPVAQASPSAEVVLVSSFQATISDNSVARPGPKRHSRFFDRDCMIWQPRNIS